MTTCLTGAMCASGQTPRPPAAIVTYLGCLIRPVPMRSRVDRGRSDLKETEMETQLVTPSRSPHMMLWVVGTAITVLCATGVAALMGWIPGSQSKQADVAAVAPIDKDVKSPANAVGGGRPAPAQTHSASKIQTAPVRVAANTPAVVKCAECGVIESMREVETRGAGSGIGAVGGAVVGGVLGNQVGHGRGKDIALVVGAVGGGLAGNEIEKRVKTVKSYEVTVRLEDGSSRVVHEATLPAWHAGDRVKVVDGAIRSN